MDIENAINVLRKEVKDPKNGLPDAVFYYATSITPMVNIDLLIQDEKGRILLSWRDDEYAGKGWHLPGGIVRYKEKLETRVKKVVENEVGVDLEIDFKPIAINEMINHDVEIRAHFISFLYKCFIKSDFIPKNKNISKTDQGYLEWHENCPDNILKFHKIYKEYM